MDYQKHKHSILLLKTMKTRQKTNKNLTMMDMVYNNNKKKFRKVKFPWTQTHGHGDLIGVETSPPLQVKESLPSHP